MDPMIVVFGLGVGVLIGLTGIGGGSLMTPLLVLFAGIQPTVAIGAHAGRERLLAVDQLDERRSGPVEERCVEALLRCLLEQRPGELLVSIVVLGGRPDDLIREAVRARDEIVLRGGEIETEPHSARRESRLATAAADTDDGRHHETPWLDRPGHHLRRVRRADPRPAPWLTSRSTRW